MSKLLFAKSMAFNSNNEPFVLVRQGTENFITKLSDEGKLKVIRKVPSGFWWFKICKNNNGEEVVILRDDIRGLVSKYSLNNDGKGKKLSQIPSSWHKIVSTTSIRQYVVIEKQIHSFDGEDYVNIHKNKNLRLPEEQNAIFFASSLKGINKCQFGKETEEWSSFFYDEEYRGCIEIAYDKKRDDLIVIPEAKKGLRLVNFVNKNREVKSYSKTSGFWSVNYHKERVFLYTWKNIIEMTSDGTEIVHEVNGVVARNECLFSTEKELYFVCENEIYKFKDEKWTKINIGNQNLSSKN
jgi:hypothetical protein